MPNSFDDAIKSLFKISHDTPLTLARSFQTTHSNPAKKKLNRDESFLEKTDSKVPYKGPIHFRWVEPENFDFDFSSSSWIRGPKTE